MKKASKTVFTCQACGYQSPKWMGKCPDCGGWGSLVEERQAVAGPLAIKRNAAVAPAAPVPIDSIEIENEQRMQTGIHEFDRVLGGGLVAGTLVLIGGDPGIGKSTLMLQALHGLAGQGRKVLYVSGEESIRQIRLRSKRLATVSPHLLVVSEVEVDAILQMIDSVAPEVVVVDSIQTMFSGELGSAPGQRQPGARGDRAADAHRPSAPASPSSSSATSPRTARSPGPSSSSTWSTRSSTSKATATTSSGSCARSRTASARPTRSGSSR